MSKYKVVTAPSLEELEEAVNHWLEKGWLLYNTIVPTETWAGEHYNQHYSQVMVRQE